MTAKKETAELSQSSTTKEKIDALKAKVEELMTQSNKLAGHHAVQEGIWNACVGIKTAVEELEAHLKQ